MVLCGWRLFGLSLEKGLSLSRNLRRFVVRINRNPQLIKIFRGFLVYLLESLKTTYVLQIGCVVASSAALYRVIAQLLDGPRDSQPDSRRRVTLGASEANLELGNTTQHCLLTGKRL